MNFIRRVVAWELLLLAVRIIPYPEKSALAELLLPIARHEIEKLHNRELAAQSRLN